MTPARRTLIGILLAAIAITGLARAGAFLLYVRAQLDTPFEAYHLESKMVHLAWRVQHGEDLYPTWQDGPPYVSNFFGPLYFGLVGLIGRAADADIDGLSRIGRVVTLAAVIGGSLVVAAAAARRYGSLAGGIAVVLSLGSAPMFGFASMTRPDALADAFGLGGFLLAIGRSRAARVAGALLLVLAVLTKQPAGVYAVAAVAALVVTGRSRSAALLTAGTATVLVVAAALASRALGPEFLPSLVAESQTGWSVPAWQVTLWRVWVIGPDLLAFTAIGLILWGRRPTRDIPLAVLATVLLVTGLITSGKKGGDLNYFLGLRSVEALAAAAAFAGRTPALSLGAPACAAMLGLGLLSIGPSLIHAAAQSRAARLVRAEDPATAARVRQYRDLYALAANPSVRLITDSGPLDVRQGARTLFGDPWLFRVLQEEGRIDVAPMVARIEAEDFDWIITTKDLGDRAYRTHDLGMPMPMVEAARRHVRPAGRRAGLFLYRPRGSARAR